MGIYFRSQYTLPILYILIMRGFILPVLATAALSRASGTDSKLKDINESLTGVTVPSDQPSKRAVGTWDDAYTKATAALAKLSQNDKIGIVSGVGWQQGNCVGNTKAASSIGYPSLCLQGKQLRFTTSLIRVNKRSSQNV